MGKKRILFLCFGNACRSAMAENIVNTLHSDKATACSAGTLQHAQCVGMDDPTITVMKEIGIDISKHRPKYFTMIEGEWDIIVNMSPDARSWIVAEMPNLLSAQWIDWEITDPRGRHIFIYRDVRDILLKKIQELMESI